MLSLVVIILMITRFSKGITLAFPALNCFIHISTLIFLHRESSQLITEAYPFSMLYYVRVAICEKKTWFYVDFTRGNSFQDFSCSMSMCGYVLTKS